MIILIKNSEDGTNLFQCDLNRILPPAAMRAVTYFCSIQCLGAYGVPKPWYFPLLRSYWWPLTKRHRSVGMHGNHDTQLYSVLGSQVMETQFLRFLY